MMTVNISGTLETFYHIKNVEDIVVFKAKKCLQEKWVCHFCRETEIKIISTFVDTAIKNNRFKILHIDI